MLPKFQVVGNLVYLSILPTNNSTYKEILPNFD